jgi:hypothetical protein
MSSLMFWVNSMTRSLLVLVAVMLASATVAHAGVAFLETSRGDGQWIVAASPNDLDALSDEWNASVSYMGGASPRIRCEGVGWVASFYDNQTQSAGVACGFGSRAEAGQASSRECTKRGGGTCRRVFSGCEDGTWTDARPGGGKNHLKDMQY